MKQNDSASMQFASHPPGTKVTHPELGKGGNSDLLKGFTVPQVVKKHGWPEIFQSFCDHPGRINLQT